MYKRQAQGGLTYSKDVFDIERFERIREIAAEMLSLQRGFPFPSLPLNEGRTYGQPEVVLISLPQVATGLRLRLPGSFRRRGFQTDLLLSLIHI